jgi:protoheme IX farnesyltransferase
MPAELSETKGVANEVAVAPPAAAREALPHTLLNRRRYESARKRSGRSRFHDYWDLAKPEITFLVALSALSGFLLASPEAVDLRLLLHAVAGIVVCSAGSSMLNHFLERRLDGHMRRTATRPLPARRVSAGVTLFLGTVLVVSGLMYLYVLVNTLTAALGLVTAVMYLAVYTPLKRVSKYNTLVGCIPGALPALGGWTAATGSLGWGGWALFGVLFVWQMPHFLSIAWMYRKDYSRSRFLMLPVVEPDGRSTGLQVLLFTVLLLAMSATPFVLGLAGSLYLAGVMAIGLYFLLAAYRFNRSMSNRDARRVLLASVIYVPAFLAIVLVDHLVA